MGADTLFTQSEVVSGKLRLEEQRLGALSHAGEGGAAGRKTAAKQQAFVDELRGVAARADRTSPAVKAALKSLIEAPVAAGGSKKARKGKTHA